MTGRSTGGGPIVGIRARAERCIERAHLCVGDLEQALWPNIDDSMRGEDHDAAANAHQALATYVSHVQTQGERDAQRWSDPVADDHKFPDGTTLSVTLDNLGEWEDILYQDAPGSEIHEVHLPVAYARELFRQADRVARDAGLVETTSQTDEEVGG